jgi:hypothetical protein
VAKSEEDFKMLVEKFTDEFNRSQLLSDIENIEKLSQREIVKIKELLPKLDSIIIRTQDLLPKLESLVTFHESAKQVIKAIALSAPIIVALWQLIGHFLK